MPDDADVFTQREEFEMQQRLKARPAPLKLPLGICNNCQAPIAANAAFCDTDCSTDWQQRQDRLKALGRKR